MKKVIFAMILCMVLAYVPATSYAEKKILVDLFGKKLETILPKQNQKAGDYTLQIPVSFFSAGTYFLTIASSNQTRIVKIVNIK